MSRSRRWNSASSSGRRATESGPSHRIEADARQLLEERATRRRSGRTRRRAGRPSDGAARRGRGARPACTKPVDAVELRSNTSAIRPIGCGPFRRSRNSSRSWPNVRSRARCRRHLARHRHGRRASGRPRPRSAGHPGTGRASTTGPVRRSMLHAREDGTRRREVSSIAIAIRARGRGPRGTRTARPAGAARRPRGR